MKNLTLKTLKWTGVSLGAFLVIFGLTINAFAFYTRAKTSMILTDKEQKYQTYLLEKSNKDTMKGLLRNAGLSAPQQKSDMLKLKITPQDRFLNGGK